MVEQTLYDANIILRSLLNDTGHPEYRTCIASLQAGGSIPVYVMPEIVYNFSIAYLYEIAKTYAESNAERAEFITDRRAYVQAHPDIRQPGWHKEMYEKFSVALNTLCMTYSDVKIGKPELYKETIAVAKETGLDWVDCILIAEHRLNHTVVKTLDKEMFKHMKSPSDLSGPISRMSLS